jgi:hypothetical protein
MMQTHNERIFRSLDEVNTEAVFWHSSKSANLAPMHRQILPLPRAPVQHLISDSSL